MPNSLWFRTQLVNLYHLRDPVVLSVVSTSCVLVASEVCVYYFGGNRNPRGELSKYPQAASEKGSSVLQKR